MGLTRKSHLLLFVLSFFSLKATGQPGYNLWLDYQPVVNKESLAQYRGAIQSYYLTGDSKTTEVISEEISKALFSLLGKEITKVSSSKKADLLLGSYKELNINFLSAGELEDLGEDGYVIKTVKDQIIITGLSDIGVLYGSFHLIRLIQTNQDIRNLDIAERPEIAVRILNHWDNLDRSSERGYAGFSIWDWHRLPNYLDPRYKDYARANASIGINGTVLTNVNSNALVLTGPYLKKVKALSDVFRPYGIKVYLTARFSAPIEIGGLETADPLNNKVQKWWTEKAKEIYEAIPDFGGFLVKANSEGQPGPQNYDRSHADGANMLAKAIKPYNGIVMWRAFVYSNEEPVDRAKQAYNEFKPLDGSFEDNVLVQVKNGPIDFQPREPFHPLFGALPKTPTMMEFQITQEYLGQATQLVYLAPMYKEVLNTDTYIEGKGSTVAKVIDGSLHRPAITGIAGVSNIGNDINWTGHPIAQSNWYAFGRLSWDPSLSSEKIAEEWIRTTFSNDENVVKILSEIMMSSWEAAIQYMTPLGLHHLMGTNHHYGPGPWVDDLPRADWTPYYYHKSDSFGIGFDRSKTGSNAVSQYAPELEKLYGDPKKCPEELLLWFHHLSWDFKLKSGRTLWEELAFNYQEGINAVRKMQASWALLEGKIDESVFEQVKMLLTIQEDEAIWWKDACMLYFQTYSRKEWPAFLEPATHPLPYYKNLQFNYAPGIKPRW